MTITAIETDRRRRRRDRRLLLRRAADDNRRLTQNDPPPPPSHPSIEEKEEIAIVEHLTRVYGEVLSIAPVSVSLAFEEDLAVEEVSIGAGGGGGDGVIRKSAFRVMGENESCRDFPATTRRAFSFCSDPTKIRSIRRKTHGTAAAFPLPSPNAPLGSNFRPSRLR